MLAFGLKSQLDNTSLEKPLNKIIEARGWVDGKTFVRDVSGWRERVGKTRLTEKGGEEAREVALRVGDRHVAAQPAGGTEGCIGKRRRTGNIDRGDRKAYIIDSLNQFGRKGGFDMLM